MPFDPTPPTPESRKLGSPIGAIGRVLALTKDPALATELRGPFGASIRDTLAKIAAQPLPGGSEAVDDDKQKVANQTDRKFSYIDAGSHYDVVFQGGSRFTVPRKLLGAKYLDYLLHNPNKPIRALDLEKRILVNRETARGEQTHQEEVYDSKAKLEIRQAIQDLLEDLKKAEKDDDFPGAERLNEEIKKLVESLKSRKGIPADYGERARNNVSKAVYRVTKMLNKGNKHQKAFGLHLGDFVSLGFEINYNQPEGENWV